jgi:AraC-like DNA-binding protein
MKKCEKQSSIPLRVGYFISPPGGATQPRQILGAELYVEMITAGHVYAPDGERLCGPGWVFVHVLGDYTIFRSPPDDHYECLTVTLQGLPRGSRGDWPRLFQWRDSDEAVKFARELLFAFHHSSVDRALLDDLIRAQLRFRMDQHRREEEREQIPPRIAVVMGEIDSHFASALSLKTLADRVDMSVSHLQAEFRRHVRLSPHQYLIQQRMRAARHRLVTTQEPIKSIAAEVGYANTEHFCRAFKKNTGHTADAFRRRYRVYV